MPGGRRFTDQGPERTGGGKTGESSSIDEDSGMADLGMGAIVGASDRELRFEYREQVGAAAAGLTVLALARPTLPHSSESVWRERIATGEVLLGEVVAAADEALRPGQWLVWRRPPWEEPPVPLALAVLYRDDDLLAVAKPRGLPSVPNGGFLTHTLLHLVRRFAPEAVAAPSSRPGHVGPGAVRPDPEGPPRRLRGLARGRGGEGLPGAGERCARRARLHGGHADRSRAHPGWARSTPRRRGKPASSEVRVLATRAGSALVEVRIATGRPHQIRIHLAGAGHPLVGDPLYAAGGLPLPDRACPATRAITCTRTDWASTTRSPADAWSWSARRPRHSGSEADAQPETSVSFAGRRSRLMRCSSRSAALQLSTSHDHTSSTGSRDRV